ncbi:MAG: DUF3383 domain-containing protein [Clostridia bacterium]|nr:DUF3383 domain-containing protein [Clostridia bacterium]
MNNLIDSLVNVSISISNGTANTSAFNNLLLVDLEKANGNVSGLNSYTTLSEVQYSGWGEDSEIYNAARIAFANGAEVLYIYTSMDKDIETALETAAKNNGWYGFTLIGDDTNLKAAADWAEDNHKLIGFTVDVSDTDLGAAANGKADSPMPIDATYYYAVAYATKLGEDNADNKYMAVAAFAKNMTYQPGSETWAYKTLSGMTPDEWDSQDAYYLAELGFNSYANCAGRNITLNGKVTAGEWTDIVRFRDWLVDDIQTRVFNVFAENAKVPYTTAGITMIENQIITSLKTGQNVGGIATTEYDDEGNKVEGYTVTMPTLSSVKEADKQARFLRGCSFTARLQGAIHLVEITGVLTT